MEVRERERDEDLGDISLPPTASSHAVTASRYEKRRIVDRRQHIRDARIPAPAILQHKGIAVAVATEKSIGAFRKCRVRHVDTVRVEPAAELDFRRQPEQPQMLGPIRPMVETDAVFQAQQSALRQRVDTLESMLKMAARGAVLTRRPQLARPISIERDVASTLRQVVRSARREIGGSFFERDGVTEVRHAHMLQDEAVEHVSGIVVSNQPIERQLGVAHTDTVTRLERMLQFDQCLPARLEKHDLRLPGRMKWQRIAVRDRHLAAVPLHARDRNLRRGMVDPASQAVEP